MRSKIPSINDIRSGLANLAHRDVARISSASGVPLPTLWNIRSGKTTNPGIETVRAFWPHLPTPRRVAA